jgi:Tfp pilus assembly protein PilN
MLRANLATRPFYNESGLRAVFWPVAALVIAAALYDAARVIQLSGRDTSLVTQASRDEARTAELRESARRMRASVDPKGIDRATAEVRLANDLIDRRVFSWTELFNRFETTLPDDVRITSVRPRVDAQGVLNLAISVSAKSRDDVNQFIEKLESTGVFRDLLAHEDHLDDHGQLEATLESVYDPADTRVASRR